MRFAWEVSPSFTPCDVVTRRRPTVKGAICAGHRETLEIGSLGERIRRESGARTVKRSLVLS